MELSWTYCNNVYKKNRKRIYIHPRITESSSCTCKTKHGKSTLLQYKITIQLQAKLPWLGLGETRQPWPYNLYIWYAMILIWHLQRFFTQQNRAATHSKVSDLMWRRQGEEKIKDHRLIRAIPSIQMLGISEGTGHTAGKEQICGLWVYRIPTHVDGMRPTQSPDPAPGDTFPHSSNWHHLPRFCTWGSKTLGVDTRSLLVGVP